MLNKSIILSNISTKSFPLATGCKLPSITLPNLISLPLINIPSDFISIFFPSILRSSKLLPFNPSDIKYIEEESSSIFSLTGFPNVSLSSVCPALILITGELLVGSLPSFIELPNLPS